MITSAQLIAEMRSWIGVPFMHQGRSRRGVDCIGVVICACKNLRLLPINFDRSNYGRLPDGDMLLKEVAAQCQPSPTLEPGGLLVMRFKRYPQHFAILTESNSIVHAYADIERVVEVGFRGPWPRRVLSCWRVPGVTYE